MTVRCSASLSLQRTALFHNYNAFPTNLAIPAPQALSRTIYTFIPRPPCTPLRTNAEHSHCRATFCSSTPSLQRFSGNYFSVPIHQPSSHPSLPSPLSPLAAAYAESLIQHDVPEPHVSMYHLAASVRPPRGQGPWGYEDKKRLRHMFLRRLKRCLNIIHTCVLIQVIVGTFAFIWE